MGDNAPLLAGDELISAQVQGTRKWVLFLGAFAPPTGD
jgi:hypothetical protein